MLSKEFEDGWKHFCDCMDFGKSTLDGEAIGFMNEMPGKIMGILKSNEEAVKDDS